MMTRRLLVVNSRGMRWRSRLRASEYQAMVNLSVHYNPIREVTPSLSANRQRIVSSGGSFFRHRITPTNVGRNRHWRRRLVSVTAGTAHREQRRGVKTEAGGGAARRASPRQFLRFPASPPAAPRGRRLRSHASQRAPGRRKPPSPPPPIEAMRCRSEATKAKRCAVGNNEAMRCRFAANLLPTARRLVLLRQLNFGSTSIVERV